MDCDVSCPDEYVNIVRLLLCILMNDFSHELLQNQRYLVSAILLTLDHFECTGADFRCLLLNTFWAKHAQRWCEYVNLI